jgi:hypothetical protein
MTACGGPARAPRPFAVRPNNSLEPTFLAGEKWDLLRLSQFRIVMGDLPEPSGGSARGRWAATNTLRTRNSHPCHRLSPRP